jgi:hypothetical protein
VEKLWSEQPNDEGAKSNIMPACRPPASRSKR